MNAGYFQYAFSDVLHGCFGCHFMYSILISITVFVNLLCNFLVILYKSAVPMVW